MPARDVSPLLSCAVGELLSGAAAATCGVVASAVLAAVSVLIPVAVCAQTAFAPTRRTLPAAPACASCRIELEPVVTIGSIRDSAFIANTARPVRTADGRYLAKGFNRGTILVFDSTGHLERTIGRLGQGPGEFGTVGAVLRGAGDSIVVLEQSRISLFSPALSFVRTFRTQGLRGVSEHTWPLGDDVNTGFVAVRMVLQTTLGAMGDDLVFSKTVDDNGVLSFHIWRVRLRLQ